MIIVGHRALNAQENNRVFGARVRVGKKGGLGKVRARFDGWRVAACAVQNVHELRLSLL